MNDEPLIWAVRFVCTDKGTHPSRELATLGLLPEAYAQLHEGGVRVRGSQRVGGRREIIKSPLVEPASQQPWQLPCPTCRRNPEFSAARMVSLMEQLQAAGVRHVDLSQRQ